MSINENNPLSTTIDTHSNNLYNIFTKDKKKTSDIIKYIIYIVAIIIISYYIYTSFKDCIECTLFRPIKTHNWQPDDVKEYFVNGKHIWYKDINKNNTEQQDITSYTTTQYTTTTRQPTIVFCHGNWGNISHRRYVLDLIKEFKCSLLLFDYSGYGKSNGKPNTKQITKDGEDVYNWLTKDMKIPPEEIVVMGESIGGSVAAHIAYKHPVSKLILLSTFSSLTDVAYLGKYSDIWKKVAYISTKIIGELSIYEKLKTIQCPVCIIHSRGDNVISYENSIKNYNSIQHDKKYHIEIEGDHINPYISIDNLNKIIEFIGIKTEISPSLPKRFSDIIEDIVRELRSQ